MVSVTPLRRGNESVPGTLDELQEFKTGEFVPVGFGGTGATTASTARANLGLVINADVPGLTAGKVASSVLPAAAAGVVGGVELDTDLGNTNTAPQVRGLYGFPLTAAPAGAGDDGKVYAYNNATGQFALTTISGSGDVTKPGGSTADTKMAVFASSDGGSLQEGPVIEGLTKGHLLVGADTGTGTVMPTSLPVGEDGSVIVADSSASRGLSYGLGRSRTRDRHRFGLLPTPSEYTLLPFGNAVAPTTYGQYTPILDSTGLWGRFNFTSTSSLSGKRLGFQYPFALVSGGQNPEVYFEIKTDASSVANYYVWFGLFGGDIEGISNLDAANGALFKMDVAATNFYLVHNDGDPTDYDVDTSMAISTNKTYRMWIKIVGGSLITWWITDGTTTQTNSIGTNVPSTSQTLRPVMLGTTMTTSITRTLSLKRFEMEAV